MDPIHHLDNIQLNYDFLGFRKSGPKKSMGPPIFGALNIKDDIMFKGNERASKIQS